MSVVVLLPTTQMEKVRIGVTQLMMELGFLAIPAPSPATAGHHPKSSEPNKG